MMSLFCIRHHLQLARPLQVKIKAPARDLGSCCGSEVHSHLGFLAHKAALEVERYILVGACGHDLSRNTENIRYMPVAEQGADATVEQRTIKNNFVAPSIPGDRFDGLYKCDADVLATIRSVHNLNVIATPRNSMWTWDIHTRVGQTEVVNMEILAIA